MAFLVQAVNCTSDGTSNVQEDCPLQSATLSGLINSVLGHSVSWHTSECSDWLKSPYSSYKIWISQSGLLHCNVMLLPAHWDSSKAATERSNYLRNEVLWWCFFPRYDSYPMNPEKMTPIPYIYNFSNKDYFLNSPRKVINSKFPQERTLNFIWYINYCACDSAQPPNFLLTLFIGNWTEKKLAGFNEGNMIPLKICSENLVVPLSNPIRVSISIHFQNTLHDL